MKKIININLSGRVLPIEDSAYEKLQGYIESLRRYFQNEESRDEIINDIESRIAELLYEKSRKGAAAVTDEDVAEVIAAMGTVEDFEAQELEDEKASASTSSTNANTQKEESYTYTEKKSRGRLYRDSNDKFIGGVCSGLASYLNVDPAVVRLLFAVIAFGTGIGFLAYIIMWIVLPPKDLEGYHGKRLYRNPDDRVFGGVAGGLAAYFGKKTSNIRLIFAAPILLNVLFSVLSGFRWHSDFDLFVNLGFGSLSGTFIITYIVLWIVLPEAHSDYEKMEMRGEKVDINRIRRNVKEGIGNVKDRMKSWSEEVKESAQNLTNKAKDFTGSRMGDYSDSNAPIRRRNNGIGHIFAVIFKAFFLFIAGVIAFSLFVGLIALLFGGVAWWPINNFLWTSKWQQALAWGTLILFLIVPLVGFITWIIRRIMKAKSRNNYLGWTFGGLWTLGWIVMVIFASSMARDFREYEVTNEPELAITQPANGKMIVAVSEDELEFRGGFGWMNDGGYGWDLSKDSLKIAAVKLTVNKSDDDKYHVYIKRYAFGKTREEARGRAADVEYYVTSKDSILDLGNGYTVNSKNKFRGQNVEVEIRVPVGKKIRFDESIEEKLNSFDVRVRRSNRRNHIARVDFNDGDDFGYRPNTDYVMEADGLKDPNDKTPAARPDSNYRYDNNSTDTTKKPSDDIQRQIEEKEKNRQQIEDDIKKLKDQQKPKSTTIKKTPVEVNNQEIAIMPSPASSLVAWF